MNEDFVLDELALRIESHCFPSGRLPPLSVPELVTLFVTTALVAIPAVAEAEPHAKQWFCEKFSLAIARRLSRPKQWLN